MNNCFNGPFAGLLDDFVNFKRSMGFKYQKESAYLKQFSAFCVNEGLREPVLTKDLSDAWCRKKPYEQQRNGTDQRVTCLRQFALYLVSLGYDAYIPLHIENKRSRKSKYVAYIFTHEEMSIIISCSDRIYPHRRSTMHLVMPVLVRLLYSTGLRIMEALRLQLKNIDLVNGIIRIEHAKFDKDRLIPFSSSTLEILKQYFNAMHPKYLPEDFLFIGISRQPYSHHEIYLRFRELLQKARIPHAGRGSGPRIHDIRHTFCCHTLQKAVNNKVDLNAALPVLSEYLGHESITATSQYLRMTAEVYPSIVTAVHDVCSYVIPEVMK
jgi:integrase/recombinase XerD